ncbi:MAG: DUF4340 domain-containing protein [Geminicoccaceae bacterium]
MSPRNFAILALATVASVALAVYAVAERDVPVQSEVVGETLFPGLLDRLNDVRGVRVTGKDAKLTVNDVDGHWVLAEKSNYPVDAATVRNLALALANLQLVEAKTADPARLPRLELDDPGAEEAKSHLVELLGADGQPLAAAIVGKSSPSLYGGGRGGVYVRRAAENQAWLAAGEIEVPGDAMALLPHEVVDLPTSEVAKITLQPAGAPALTLSRADAAGEFTTDAALPEGRELDPVKLEALAGTLAGLTMSDVRPAGELTPPADAPHARFQTFDGLVVEGTLVREGEGDVAKNWLLLQAGAEAAPAASAPAEPAKSEDAAAAETKQPADRAAEISARVDGWAYQIPPYLAERFDDDLEKLLAEPTPAS